MNFRLRTNENALSWFLVLYKNVFNEWLVLSFRVVFKFSGRTFYTKVVRYDI